MSGSSDIVNGNIHANYRIDTNTAFVNGVGEAVDTVTGNNIATLEIAVITVLYDSDLISELTVCNQTRRSSPTYYSMYNA